MLRGRFKEKDQMDLQSESSYLPADAPGGDAQLSVDTGHHGTQPKRGSTQSLVGPGRQGRVVKEKLGTTPRTQEEQHEERSRILRERNRCSGEHNI